MFLGEYTIPVISGICLCVAYVVKKWIPDEKNKYIPTLCAVLGLILALALNWGAVNIGVILGGLFSGLSATGLHQTFKQIVEGEKDKGGKNKNE